jgi:hypothetical protein
MGLHDRQAQGTAVRLEVRPAQPGFRSGTTKSTIESRLSLLSLTDSLTVGTVTWILWESTQVRQPNSRPDPLNNLMLSILQRVLYKRKGWARLVKLVAASERTRLLKVECQAGSLTVSIR